MMTSSLSLLAVVLLLTIASIARGHDLDPIAADPPADGLLVVRIVPDSQAKKLGMHHGDILTHYDGVVLTDPDSLVQAVKQREASGASSAIPLRLIRDHAEQTVTVAPGRLGVQTLAVKKGIPLSLRPPATPVEYDFTPLKRAPMETWYTFHIDGQKVGFEHHVLSLLEDGRLRLESEVAFDYGEWAVQHFHVTTTAEIQPAPRTTESVYRFVPGGFTTTARRFERDGKSLATIITREGDQETTAERPIAGDWQSDYLMAQLAAFMKPTPGTCQHYTVFDLSTGAAIGPSSNYCNGEEAIDVDGRQRRTHKYETHSLAAIVRIAWVDPDTRQTVKFFYGNNTEAFLTTKDKALAGLSPKITPVTAGER